MPAANPYTKEQISIVFNKILNEIEKNKPLYKIVKDVGISSRTFYEWCDNSEQMQKDYMRACEIRADKIFEECLDIVDNKDSDTIVIDGETKPNFDIIQRNRLQFDARRWMAGKLAPTKYNDKLTVSGDKDNPMVPMLDMSKLSVELLEQIAGAYQLKESNE
jgi:hypothetical protein